VEGLAGLLGRLLGREDRPLEVALARAEPGVVEVELRLAQPVAVSLGHRALTLADGVRRGKAGGRVRVTAAGASGILACLAGR
jgi:hypothetical protein